MGVETFYLVPKDPAAVLQHMRDPATIPHSHENSNFGVERGSRVDFPPHLSNFTEFTLSDSSGRFGFGGSSMKELRRKQLNLSHSEFDLLKAASERGHSELENAWRQVFVNRAQAFQNGGLIAALPYETSGPVFQHHPEWIRLLKGSPKILKEFQSLIGVLMTGKGLSRSEPATTTWESSRVQGEQVVALYCMVDAPRPGAGHRVVETAYFVTGKYLTSMVFYELAPIEVDGIAQTMIWRSDFVITQSIGFLKGIERVAAENVMLQEVKTAAAAFLHGIMQE